MPKIFVVHFEEDPEAVIQYRMLSRFLWEEHVVYVRNAIISTLAGLDDIDAVVDKLNSNASELGQLLVRFYTADDADKFTQYLKDHISNSMDIFKYIKAGRVTSDLENLGLTIDNNIASLLNILDPNSWPKSVVLDLLKSHADCTIKQAISRSRSDWVGDIAAFDSCRSGIANLADTFSNVVVTSFPEKFIKYDDYISTLPNNTIKKRTTSTVHTLVK
jgi:hypothetical protein